MFLKRQSDSPRSCGLYAISPPHIEEPEHFADAFAEALQGGPIAALQIRIKPLDEKCLKRLVLAIKPIARKSNVCLILNDTPDLAGELGFDGVHLGQSDISYGKARQILGPDTIIGITCHDSYALGMTASESGADYVAFGAFFPSPTKKTVHRPGLDLLSTWRATMTLPCVAIGGITPEKAPVLAKAGADFLAVSSGIWQFQEGPRAAVAAFHQALRQE